MNEGERLKYLRKTLKMTQKDFGEKIGLKANTVSDIENGKYNLKEASIRLTCSEFKIDYIWLTTGEGEMFSNDKDDEDCLRKIEYIMTGENNFHKNLFKTFASLSEDELETLEKIIDRFLEIKKEKETYIFSGLLRCSHCGYKIVGHYSNRSGKNVIKTYRCNRYSIYKDCDQKKSINEKKLEKVLLSCIVEEYKNYLYSFDVSSKKTNSIDVSQNKSKIQKKVDKLRELYLNDLISLEDYKKDYAIFTQALKEIESKEVTKVAPKDADKILSILDNIETIYYNLDATERKRFWSSFIDVITIDGNYNIDIKFL